MRLVYLKLSAVHIVSVQCLYRGGGGIVGAHFYKTEASSTPGELIRDNAY